MAKRKSVRQKGKIRLSEYFKNLNDGDQVSVIVEKSVRASFPKRLQGLSGKVVGSRGSYKMVELNVANKAQKFIIHPVHLRKV